MTTVVVLSDTHISPSASRRIPGAVYGHLRTADVILHAGDVVTGELITELEGFAPLYAVLGNNDFELTRVLPETREVDIDGYRIAMIHDSGASSGRAERMHRRFGEADMVVFGHSHLPLDVEGIAGQRLFNPGSATWKRMAPTHTIGLLEIENGMLESHRLVDV